MITDVECAPVRHVRMLPEVKKDYYLLRLVTMLILVILLTSMTVLATRVLIGQASTLDQLPQAKRGEHTTGIIRQVGESSFTLQTKSGQMVTFLCGSGCYASLPHLQRHLHERALTDVYYVLDVGDHRFHAQYVD